MSEQTRGSEFEPSRYLTKIGKADYLEVKWRVVWLRTEYPDAKIRTKLHSYDQDEAVFHCTIELPTGAEASGWGSETPGDFGDYLEKAETKAIGRALAVLGYGTQFSFDLEDGGAVGKPVDSPVTRAAAKKDLSGEPAPPAMLDLVKRQLAAAGIEADGYLTSNYVEGLNRGQAAELLNKLKSGEIAAPK